MVIPGTDKIISKPFGYWSQEHQNVAQVPIITIIVHINKTTQL